MYKNNSTKLKKVTIGEERTEIKRLAKNGVGIIEKDGDHLSFLAVNSISYCFNDILNSIYDAHYQGKILIWEVSKPYSPNFVDINS